MCVQQCRIEKLKTIGPIRNHKLVAGTGDCAGSPFSVDGAAVTELCRRKSIDGAIVEINRMLKRCTGDTWCELRQYIVRCADIGHDDV